MNRVFLSSAFVELEACRKRAFEAIDQSGFLCVRMENFAAADRETSTFCRDQLAACDAVVLILGRLYGTPIPGRDISYTEDEFDTALALKKPILAFEPADRAIDIDVQAGLDALPEKGITYEEQLARLRRFAQKVHRGRAVRPYKSAEDLKFWVHKSLRDLFPVGTAVQPETVRTAYPGERLPQLCNRGRQMSDFGEHFQSGRPGCPEIYAVCGHEDELPKRCVQRLVCFHINYPRRDSTTPVVGPADDHATVEWPFEEDDPETIRFNRLCRGLFQSLNPTYTFPKQYRPEAFCELALATGVPYLRLRHVIPADRWNAASESLLVNRYVPFWKAVRNWFRPRASRVRAPRMLVFMEFSHRLGDDDGRALHRRLGDVLTRTGESNNVFCRMLPELPPVRREDLQLWYDRYESWLPAEHRHRSVEALFPQPPLRMAQVEQRIRELVGL